MSVLRMWSDWFGWWGVVALPVFVALYVVILTVPSPTSDRETKLCDEQVQILLTTTDLVDFERAKYLIDWFNCSIRRRLP